MSDKSEKDEAVTHDENDENDDRNIHWSKEYANEIDRKGLYNVIDQLSPRDRSSSDDTSSDSSTDTSDGTSSESDDETHASLKF